MKNFADPVEHASILVEVCGGVEDARDVAEINRTFSWHAEDILYWKRVEEILTPEAEPCRMS